MKQRLQQWSESIDALGLRERILVLVGTVAVVFLLMDALFYQPALARQKEMLGTISNWQLHSIILEQESQEVLEQQNSDPLQWRRDQVVALQTEQEELHRTIEEQLGVVMDPGEAIQILRDILHQEQELRLLDLQTEILGLEEIDTNGWDPEAGAAVPGLARFQITLSMEGSYGGTLRFLQQLEALPWALFWEQLDLNVTDHPRSQIELRIYTLAAYGDRT